jgi:adenylate kinase family enzyme
MSLTAPLIDYYGGKGLVSAVNGEGEQDVIFADILKALQSKVSS